MKYLVAAAVVVLVVLITAALAYNCCDSGAWGVLYVIPVGIAAIWVGMTAGLFTAVVCSVLNWTTGPAAQCEHDPVILPASLVAFGLMAIAGNRIYASMSRQRACCGSLAELGKAVSSSLDLPVLLKEIVEKTAAALGGKGALIRLLDEPGEKLLATASCGLSQEYLEKGAVSVQASGVDQQTLKGETVISHDVRKDTRFQYPIEMQREGIGSMICTPIVVAGKPRGVLRLYRANPSRFDAHDRWLMETATGFAGVAITNALAHEALKADTETWQKRINDLMRRYTA